MCKVQMLRALVKQRLTAAAEEIFGLFERTIAEYEEELCRSKEENERQRKLLDAVFNPQLRLHRAGFPADVLSVTVVSEEDVPPEQQQEWRPSLDQKDPETPHIKEEQEEVRTSQEGEQFQGFTFTPVPVKSEDDDEEKPQSSQLYQSKTEHMETDDGEDCGGPKPDRTSDPNTHLQPHIDDKNDYCSEPETKVITDEKTTTREAHFGSSLMKNNRFNSYEKPFCCSECGKRFNQNSNMKTHMRIHTGEKPFSCSVCGKNFVQRSHLTNHLKRHTGEKPYSCLRCNRRFCRSEYLQSHMRIHTGEKPFCCSVCGKRFAWRCQLRNHKCAPHIKEEQEKVWTSQNGEQLQGLEETAITKCLFTPVPVRSEDVDDDEEKPQSSQLHQRQTEQMETGSDEEDCGGPEPARTSDPDTHLQPDTGDKTENFSERKTDDDDDLNDPDRKFRCPVCGKTFKHKGNLNIHMRTHTGVKPFSCSLCSKSFTQKASLDNHLKTHRGEKSFSCSLCGKHFGQKAHLQSHLTCHTGEKPYSCSICNNSFSRCDILQAHMRTHTGEKPFSCSVCDKRFTWRCQLKNHKCGGESSQLHHSQSEQMGTEVDREDCGGPEPDRHLTPVDKAEDSSECKTDDSDDYCKDPDKKPFCCSVCGKTFKQRASMTIHTRTHAAVKPFSCPLCNRTFTQKAGLDYHLKRHKGEKSYSCSICDKCFSRCDILQAHMRTHTGEKPFSCSVCDKRFAWRCQLKNHKCCSFMNSGPVGR